MDLIDIILKNINFENLRMFSSFESKPVFGFEEAYLFCPSEQFEANADRVGIPYLCDGKHKIATVENLNVGFVIGRRFDREAPQAIIVAYGEKDGELIPWKTLGALGKKTTHQEANEKFLESLSLYGDPESIEAFFDRAMHALNYVNQLWVNEGMYFSMNAYEFGVEYNSEPVITSEKFHIIDQLEKCRAIFDEKQSKLPTEERSDFDMHAFTKYLVDSKLANNIENRQANVMQSSMAKPERIEIN